MFDPDERVPYASLPMSVVGSEAHRALAREAAQKSIVLLKNDGGLLPLDARRIKRIAVIGPNADNFEALLGNYHGIPKDPVTVVAGIRRRVGGAVHVDHLPGSHLADGMLNLSAIPVTALRTPGGKRGLTGEYFDNSRFSGDPVLVRDDRQVDFYWEGGSPAPELPDDGFSIRWRGFLVPPATGEYRIGTWSMPAIQVRLDKKIVVRFQSIHHALHVQSAPLALEAGKPYPLEIHYRNTYGDADARLLWSPPQPDMQERAVRLAKTADVVVLVLGLSQRLEGEEMPIEIDGFKGGDRVHLRLPKPQDDLLRAVADNGKPLVVVMMNGSAIAIHSAVERAGAVLMAGYPGEQGGNAVADVLFGDVSPAGRLPVTWYRSVEDLPPFEDYAMKGRTYRYFGGQPLFPFGFGLSYTRFTYSHLELPARAGAGQSVPVAVDVTNSGSREGDEVVQLYVTDEKASTPRPIRQLEGMERIRLAPGETRTVRFTLSPRQLSLIDAVGNRVVEPGAFTIAVGGKQPGFAGAADSPDTQVLTGRLTLAGRKVTLEGR
jgi:beta-glucosidase